MAQNIVTGNCRCFAEYIYSLEDLPADMLTAKGRKAISDSMDAYKAGKF